MTDDWGFSAVYPDGSRLLTCGEPADSTAVTGLFPVEQREQPGHDRAQDERDVQHDDGGDDHVHGLAGTHAMMPMFSPDGKKIVFNDVDNDGGHALVVQDFNTTTNIFSNPVVIYKDASNYPGWPFFTPDSETSCSRWGPRRTSRASRRRASAASAPCRPLRATSTTSDLYITCVLASPGTAQALNLANGVSERQPRTCRSAPATST